MRFERLSLKTRFVIGGIACAVALSVAATLFFVHNFRSPNIVLIVIDTLRADHLPAYGYEKPTAPFLSRLAEEGVLFKKAQSVSSWTAPATASIITSLYPFQHGVIDGYNYIKRRRVRNPEIRINQIPNTADTLAEILKSHGYQTYAVADNLNICPELGFDQGFMHFIQRHEQGAGWIADILKAWGRQINHGQPYFIYLHFNDPHYPYLRHEPWYGPQEDEFQDLLAAYDSEIRYVDEKIRELYALFDWGKNTLLIITADHGEEFKEHGHIGHGKTLYQEVLHVPLIMSFPRRLMGPKIITDPVSTLDVLPTVLDMLDISLPDKTAGISLTPYWDKKVPQIDSRPLLGYLRCVERECFLPVDGVLKSILAYPYKYLNVPGHEMLFHLPTDPQEQKDFLRAEPQRVNRLKSRMESLMQRYPRLDYEYQDIELSPAFLDDLRSLGYLQ